MATPISTEAAKAWIGRFYIRAHITDERVRHSPTAGGETVYYSRNIPIVNCATLQPTDDENQLTVYDDGVPVAPGAYTLTGSLGRIVFGVAPANGSVITIDYCYYRRFGFCRSVTVRVDGGVDGIYTLGQRLPKELLEGAIKITGAAERFHINLDLIGKLGELVGDRGQEYFTVYLFSLGEYPGKPAYTLTNVKFSPFELSLPDPNSPIIDRLEFEALNISSDVV